MRVSNGMPSASSVSAAWRMVSQSDWLPMMIPTRAVVSVMVLFLSRSQGGRNVLL